MKLWLGLIMATAMQIASAQAATVTRIYSFIASDFIGDLGTTGPIDTVSGSFRITFDPNEIGVTARTSGLEVLSLSFPNAGPVGYSTYAGTRNLSIGSPSDVLIRGENTFSLTINNGGIDFFSVPRPIDRADRLRYTTAGTRDIFVARQLSFVLGSAIAVPGSVAGAGIPALMSVSVLWFIRRRRVARSSS